MKPSLLLSLLLIAGIAMAQTDTTGEIHARRVLIIGVDGMSPDGIAHASTPVMDSLMAHGRYSLSARAVLPTVSSPNWASMINGASPAEHGIRSNAWKPGKDRRERHCGGERGERWPTLFGVLRSARPDARIGVFHDWGGFGRLVEPGACDVLRHVPGAERTARQAAEWWLAERPDLVFVHLDHVDGAGHAHGYGSPAYYAAVEEADRLIGLLVDAVDRSGLAPETLLIVTSDHGGKGHGHGGDSPEERTIPWMAAGSGIVPGQPLPDGMPTYATAATVLFALGVPAPECWIGRPVTQAFGR